MADVVMDRLFLTFTYFTGSHYSEESGTGTYAYLELSEFLCSKEWRYT